MLVIESECGLDFVDKFHIYHFLHILTLASVHKNSAAPSADALLGSSAGRADLNVAKNKIGQNSNANKRKRTEPKILG